MCDHLDNAPDLIMNFTAEAKRARPTNPLWLLLVLTFSLGFDSGAAAQNYQDPLSAYTTGTIYVFEHMKDPVTVLYDGATSLPDATVYYGVIKNVDGSPAAGAKFSARMLPGGPGQVAVVGRHMHTDEQGRFRFALKQNLSFDNIFMSGEAAGSREWTRAQEAFTLVAGQQNVLVSRLRKSFLVRLMLADGTELTSATITGRANLLKPSSSFLGRCLSLPPDNPYGDAEFRLNHTSDTHSFILHNLAIPGTYNAMVDGRVFKPFAVTEGDYELILQEDARPFTLKGRVTDLSGKPITGALVILDNGNSWQLRETAFDSVQEAWQKSLGRYDELGFYMAETNEEGRYEISGNCAGMFSSLFVYGDGYQSASRAQLFPNDQPSTPAHNATRFGSSENLGAKIFSGSRDLEPVRLARPATLKMKLRGGPSPKPKSFYQLRSPVSDNEPENWDIKPTQDGDKTVFTVPADIPFDIVWVANGKYSISIKTPLKPSEVRDLGKQKWVQEK